MANYNQSKSQVAGDQVGRDKIEAHYHPVQNESAFDGYVEEFRKQVEDAEQIEAILEELRYYTRPAARETVRPMNLAEKLRKVDRTEDEIFDAQDAKEEFAKLLHSRSLSIGPMRVYALLLADVVARYRQLVYPLIVEAHGRQAVDRALYEHVIAPIQERIAERGIPIAPHHAPGMLYYLAGNCHIVFHHDSISPGT
jgi:hypothetical protein